MEKEKESAFRSPQEQMEDARYHVPFTLPSDTAIEEISGEALCHTPGVLGLKGNPADLFRTNDEIRRGILVQHDDGKYIISAKIVGDSAYDPDELQQRATAAVAKALLEGAGMEVVDFDIRVDESMSAYDFDQQFGAERSCDCVKDTYS